MKSYVNSFILILIILNIHYESINLKILKKNKITNSDLWASEWFEKHKNYLTSMTEQQIKFRLNQELAKHSRINQKSFDDILQFILMKKKQLFLSNKKYSIIFQLLRY
jgi:hypothetical protein